MKRMVLMISDGTGITVESLGNSLLTQFEDIEFEKEILPYVNSIEQAEEIIIKINDAYQLTKIKPLVFYTLINPEIRLHLKTAQACFFDLFGSFLDPLEKELEIKSSYTVGRAHSLSNTQSYEHRIKAINFALAHDDGIKPHEYNKAEIILIGVSRAGKTPSCLYMALQFGILAANYPFTIEDIDKFELPNTLKAHKKKLFGLTINPNRLSQIRSERQPQSQYASIHQCRLEISEIERLYLREQIPFINSTSFSIEEITTKIISAAGIKRRI